MEKWNKKIYGGFILLIILIFLPLTSAETYKYDYKTASYFDGKLNLTSIRDYSCVWNVNSNWKNCSTILQISNSYQKYNLNKNQINALIEIPYQGLTKEQSLEYNNITKEWKTLVEYSDYEFCSQHTECNDNLNFTEDWCGDSHFCMHRYYTIENYTWKEYYNWVDPGNTVEIPLGDSALRLNFQVDKYASTHFNFSLGGYILDPEIDACGTLSENNTVYTLNQSISSTGTCFTITGINTTLDCNGYTINLTDSGTTYGVYTSKFNATVKNCYINQTGTGAIEGMIYYTHSPQYGDGMGTIFNNTIRTTQTGSYGIYIYRINMVNITNNTVLGEGSGTSRSNVYIYDANDVLLDNMRSSHSAGGSSGTAINLNNGNRVIINNSVLHCASSGTLYLSESSNLTLENTNITVSTGDKLGVYAYGTGNDYVWDYNITSNNNLVNGHPLNYSYDKDNLVIENANWSGVYGQWVCFECNNLTMRNISSYAPIGLWWSSQANIIDLNISTSQRALHLHESDYINISNLYTSASGYSFYQLSSHFVNLSGFADSSTTSTTYMYIASSSNSNYSNINIHSSVSGAIPLQLTGTMSNNYFDDIHLSTWCSGCVSGTSNTIYITNAAMSNFVINNSEIFNNRTTSWNGLSPSIYVYSGQANFSIYNSNLTNYIWSDVFFRDSSTVTGSVFNLTNCTVYNEFGIGKADRFGGVYGELNKLWYADVYVNDTAGNPIEGANVTSTDVNSILQNWSLTNSSGYITRLTLREYWENATSKYFDTNYTFMGNKTDYTGDIEYVNLTMNYVNGDKIVLTLTASGGNNAPQISLNQPLNSTQFNNTQNINFNFTATDDINATLNCSIYLDNILNQTNSSTLNNTLTNFLITGITYGNHNWSINCSDGSLTNISEIRLFSIADIIPPYFTNIPNNASLWYGNESLGVDFDADDDIGFGTFSVNDSQFIINSTGYLSNTTPLGAGFYLLNITINDTSNNINWTLYQVEINKSSYACNVLFNETLPITYPNTFLVYSDCTSGFFLYRNGTVISNNSEQTLGAGAYNFTVIRNDTVNYTYYYDEEQFVINKADNPLTLTSSNGWTLTYPTETTLECTADSGSPDLFKEDVGIANPTTDTYGYGAYNIKCNISESENYTSNSTQNTLTVNKNTSSCDVFFNATSPQTYPYNFIVYTNCTSDYALYRNGSAVTNASTQSLSAGYWNFTVVRADNQNYSNYLETRFFTITKYTTSLTLSALPSWAEIYPTQTNISGSGCPSALTCKLYRNSVEVTSPDVQNLSAGTYPYVYNTSGNENYTSDSETNTLTINKNDSDCDVFFNATSPQTYPYNFIVYTNCSTDYVLYRDGTPIANASTQDLVVGNYNFTVQRNDTINYSNIVDTEYFAIQNASGSPPVAYQGTNPVNNYSIIVSGNASIIFDMRCTDDVNVSWISLFSDWTGSWTRVYSNLSYTNNTWINISQSIPYGTWRWAVWCNNTLSMENITTNRTIIVNAVQSPSAGGSTGIIHGGPTCDSVGGICTSGICSPGTHKINYDCGATTTQVVCCSLSLCDITKNFTGHFPSWTSKQFEDLLNFTKNTQFYDINESQLKDYVENYEQKCNIPVNKSGWKVILIVAIVLGFAIYLGYKENEKQKIKKQKQMEEEE